MRRTCIEEINADEEVSVRWFVGDLLERHFIRCLISHAGHFSCEQCESEGRGSHKGVDWEYPAAIAGRKRTHASMHAIAQ